jgi:hypothetical protein
MPNELAVESLPAVRTITDLAAVAKVGANQPSPQPEQAPSSSPYPNPSLRLDPALGIVVLEFRSDTGAVTTSIPSERQLQAYQRWDATHLGPAPAGRAGNSGADPRPAPGSDATSDRHTKES